MEWTDVELSEFIELLNMIGSQDQMERISSRMEMSQFVKKHGKKKCDAMFFHMDDNNL